MDTGQGWADCPPLANAETTPLMTGVMKFMMDWDN